MRTPTSELLSTRHHATMVTMTALRKDWPQRQFRLDDATMKTLRVKLATEEEKFQGVMESLARGYIAGLIDLATLREELATRGLLPE